MRTTNLILWTALWAFLLAPAACMMGALSHVCPHSVEIGCGHESACEDDPCDIQVLPRQSGNPGISIDRALRGAVTHPAGVAGPAPALIRIPCLDLAGPPVPDMPVPAAALPLLC
jgi:hypothetical protein